MGQVTVIVNGRTYRLACGDGEEGRLVDLAEHVRQRIDDLSYEFGHAGDDRLLLMATLMITDELWETKARLAALETQQPTAEPDFEIAGAAAAVSQPPSKADAAPAPAEKPPEPTKAEQASPAKAEAYVQEPSLKRALRRNPPETKSSLADRIADATQPQRKTGAT